MLAIADSLKSNEFPAEVFGASDTARPKPTLALIKETLEKLFGQRKYRRPFLILNGLFLIMLFSGSFAISFYAVEIFRKADPHHNEHQGGYLSAIGVGAIKLIGSLLFIPAIMVCI